ncbi:MAG: glycerol-3-phosphate acyltransferase [Actinomycetota bacterium]|nr:glycerol-3-phosphate acyltransferase [Actinomycetota bacterium]
MDTVALAVGPVAVVCYLAMATVHAWLRSNGRSRRAFAAPRALAVIEAVAAVALATAAWMIVRRVAPGGDQDLSRLASLSPQVLTAWESVALWCGLAAVVGQVAPVWWGFRNGGDGLAPAAGLLAAYAPVPLLLAVGSASLTAIASRRRDLTLAIGLVGLVAFEWLGWWADWPSSWGSTNGPELTLWSAVLAGVLFAAGRREQAPAAEGPSADG